MRYEVVVLGWKKDGRAVPQPFGYDVWYYFDGQLTFDAPAIDVARDRARSVYLGADKYGVEPEWDLEPAVYK